MNCVQTSLQDCILIKPKIFEDKRGFFLESFHSSRYFKLIGPNLEFVQDNHSNSTKGVLRGLHFQKPPFEQTKLVRVVYGKVLDVAVDLREGSPTYGKHHSIELSDENKLQFLIPKGFAHGFITLSDKVIFSYKVDAPYSAEHESGIHPLHNTFNLDWRVSRKDIVISKKDFLLPNFTNK